MKIAGNLFKNSTIVDELNMYDEVPCNMCRGKGAGNLKKSANDYGGKTKQYNSMLIVYLLCTWPLY